jgi:uncharacterized membrane protein YcaP (DUF421 family)
MFPDLEAVFRLDENALELFIRTTVIYLGLVLALRIVGRREVGSLELTDLLMIVLIADGVQNGMAGDYTSVSGAVIIAGTLIGWNYALSWLTYVSPHARSLLLPEPLLLIEEGRYQRRNMRREMVTHGELESLLRNQGIEDASAVKAARLEPNGELSVIRAEPGGADNGQQRSKRRKVP